MTTLPFLLIALSPVVIFDSDYALISCPLCKSNTLWNSFMILGRNVEQKDILRTMTALAFLILELSPFIFVWNRFHVHSVSEKPLESFDGTW